MKTTISLTKFSAVTIRRIYSSLAFILNCVCLGLLLFGFVPFYGRSMGAIDAVNCVFEIFDISLQHFWYVATCVLFAIFYVLIIIKVIKSILTSFSVMKTWLLSNFDSMETREKSDYVVSSSNSSLILLLMLYVFSNFVRSFKLTGRANAVIIVLIVANAIINALKLVYEKRNITEALSISIGCCLVLYALTVYAFSLSTLQIASFFHSFPVFFKLPLTDVPFSIVMELILTLFFAPIIHFLAIRSMFALYSSINVKSSYNGEKSKKLMIRNIVYVVCALIVVGYANDYKNLMDYFELINNHIDILALSVMVYVSMRNTDETIADVGYFDPPPAHDESTSKRLLAPEIASKVGADE